MSNRTHSNLHGKTAGGKIYYDKRIQLCEKIARTVELSQEAKKRLKWIDYYAKTKNGALTSRYFGISESCFWKWKKRFDQDGIRGLENKSKRPKRVRKPETHPNIIEKIQKLRRLYPNYGKRKIKVLLNEQISESTIGRVIKRHQMFYRKRKKKKYRWRWGEKQRIKDLVLYGEPGEHVQMDTIVLFRYGKTYYIKTAIDTVTKIGFAYAYHRNSSQTSVEFLKKLQYVLPYEIKNIHTDNGSEFLGLFEDELRKQKIKHYFSYPHCPKQHGAIERFNRTIQEEFLREGNFYESEKLINQHLNKWLIEYNFHRPHASLDYQNPLEFFDLNFVQLLPTQSSSMYWTSTKY